MLEATLSDISMLISMNETSTISGKEILTTPANIIELNVSIKNSNSTSNKISVKSTTGSTNVNNTQVNYKFSQKGLSVPVGRMLPKKGRDSLPAATKYTTEYTIDPDIDVNYYKKHFLTDAHKIKALSPCLLILIFMK